MPRARHRWHKHGAYSTLRALSAGELDWRSKEGTALRSVVRGLHKDLGDITLTQRQQDLVETAAALSVFAGKMILHALQAPFGKDGTLNPVLGEHLLAFLAEKRRSLETLFGERRSTDDSRDPGEDFDRALTEFHRKRREENARRQREGDG